MVDGYYIDTSIWIDLYEDRKGYAGEPLGDYALQLLVLIRAKNIPLFISDMLIKELEGYYSLAEINGMMKPFEKIIRKVFSTQEQLAEARKIAGDLEVPFGDALHAIFARDNHLILVTRDNDFRKLEDISAYSKPEDII